MADAVFRLSVRGAAREGRRLDRAQRALGREIIRSLTRMARLGVSRLRTYARVDTGAMRDSIRFDVVPTTARPRAVITIDPDARGAGIDYLNITRRGHRRQVITAKKSRFLAVHADGRFAKPLQMVSVRGFNPPTDWVNVAESEIDLDADAELDRLGRVIDTRVLR